MILIAEPVHFGATHVQVNSAFIALFKDIYKNQKLDVYAEEKHIAELKQKLVTQASSIYFDSFKPVSYTHLDVYKRQLESSFSFNILFYLRFCLLCVF